VARPKDLMDNALPGANSLAAVALLRLGALTGVARFDEAAHAILALLGQLSGKHPLAFGHLLGAVDLATAGITEVVITGDRPDLVAVVTGAFRPNTVLAWGERYDSPLWEGRDETGASGRAYVCRHHACRMPVTTPEELRAELGSITNSG
jgi:uncharacterized protein YyaL (SSP411 family)